MSKAFTLVEIMIVVAIIALLAAIAIPNLLRARVTATEGIAQATLKTISTACESYAAAYAGAYPRNELAMTNSTPTFLFRSYCLNEVNNYNYSCNFLLFGAGYTISANSALTGGRNYTIQTGGRLTTF